ncbi:MAG: hypothetical protein KAT04_09660 [Methylococcales bacterium]|nr:hypothetical protein [Methylococcales bacterium]
MIKMNFISIFTVTILMLSTSITLAEESFTVVPEQIMTRNINTPVRGLTMDQVKKQLGQPLKIIAAVGEPPITRWIYKDFIVYFEHNLVLHSVFPDK